MSQKVFAYGESVNEKSTAKYSCRLLDPAGAPVALASVITLKVTLKAGDGTVINSRNAQSALNVNGGSLDSTTGDFALILGESDTALSGTAQYQKRLLTLDVVYTSGRLTHDVVFYVRALDDVS